MNFRSSKSRFITTTGWRYARTALATFSLIVSALVFNSANEVMAQNPTSPGDASDAPDARGTSTGARGPTVTPSSGKTKPGTAAPEPGDTGFEIFYVKDKDGELIPVTNLRYEDYLRLYQIDRGLNAALQPPQYSIENLLMTGQVQGESAELNIEIQIKVLSDKTVRVPLRLNDAIMLAPVQFDGDGEQVLKTAGEEGGLVCWLKGKPNSVQKIQLKVVTPIVQVGDESRLNLSLPTANASSLKLEIPEESISATVSPTSRVVGQTTNKDGQTELSVVGAKSEFQLGWTGTTKQPVAESPLLLDAKGVIQVRVKGPGAVSTHARITVSSSDREMESVRIRLPEGCKPVAVEDTRYTTEFVSPAGPVEQNTNVRPIAIVKFTEPTFGPIDVQFSVEQSGPESALPNPDSKANEANEVDVLGFEVIDALRQYGTVSLIAEGAWLVRTSASSDLRRLGEIPDAIAQEGLVAAFEYYRQPASLPIKVLAKETRVNVDPTYIFDVQPDAVELTAILKCQVLGAPAFSLSVDMTGWEVKDVGPGLVQEENLRLSEVSPLEIPLATAMQSDFQIRITARRKIEAGADTLQLQLPSLRRAAASAAIVVVNPADNLSLTSRQGDESAAPMFDLEPLPENLVPQRARAALCYRYRGDSSDANLVYDFGLRERSTRVDVDNDIRIEKIRTSIIQRMTYDVLYQPLNFATLRIPHSLVDNKSFRVLLDGEELDRADFAIETDIEGLYEQDEIWKIQLRSPRLGIFQLETRYELPWSLRDVINGVQTEPFDVSLQNTILFARPDKTAVSDGMTVQIGCPKQYAAQLSEYDPWAFERSSSPASDLLSLAEYEATTWPRSVSIEARQLEQQQSQAAMVERLFAQTWMTKDQRQDRIAATISGATSPLRIQLPLAASTDDLYVLVDGKKVARRPEGNNGIAVELPNARNGRIDGKSRIELVYQYRRRPPMGQMAFELPTFESAEYVRKFYWQVVVPQDEHLLSHGKRVTAEHAWERRGLAWFRKPRIEQSQMEAFAEATTQSAPGAANNHYLFAGFGESPDLEVHTASRRWLLLVASGFVLAFGILWQWLPWIGHRSILIPLSLAICAAAWLYPGPAVIVAQAAVLGLGVAVFARMLDWGINRRRVDSPSQTSTSDSQTGRSATIIRGSSIAQPRSTDALSVPAAGQQ